jgi:hypothetical protein
LKVDLSVHQAVWHRPQDSPTAPPRFFRTSRLLAAALLLLFLGARLVTTTVILGRYRLTATRRTPTPCIRSPTLKKYCSPLTSLYIGAY